MKSLFSHFNASMIFLTTDGRDCHVELEDDSQVGTAWVVLVHIAGRRVSLWDDQCYRQFVAIV